MERNGRPRRQFSASSVEPTTLHEITRRYVATALALSKAMGVPYTEAFLREHRESVTSCFIQAGMEGIRLPGSVRLPPLAPAPNGAPELDQKLSDATIEEAAAPNGAPEAEPHRDPLPPEEGEAAAPSPNGQAPVPTVVPKGFPSSGVPIRDLRPAVLHMLVQKVASLVHAEGERWVSLLAELQGPVRTKLLPAAM